LRDRRVWNFTTNQLSRLTAHRTARPTSFSATPAISGPSSPAPT
jgi:hypothetical protein